MSAYCGAGYCPRPYAAACHRGRRRGDRVPYSIAIAGSGHRFLIAHILRRATWIQGCRTPWVFHHFPLSGPEEAPAKKIRKRSAVSIWARSGALKACFRYCKGRGKVCRMHASNFAVTPCAPKRRLAVNLRVACAVLTRIVRADSARFACAFFGVSGAHHRARAH